MYNFGDMSFSKALLAGRPAADTQICPLYKEELRSAIRAPLVISGELCKYQQFAKSNHNISTSPSFRPSILVHCLNYLTGMFNAAITILFFSRT